MKMWQDRWDGVEHKKLNSIKANLGVHKSASNCKEQVVMTRCRIDHSRSTHGHLLVGDSRPQCIPCDRSQFINQTFSSRLCTFCQHNQSTNQPKNHGVLI